MAYERTTSNPSRMVHQYLIQSCTRTNKHHNSHCAKDEADFQDLRPFAAR